jgi:hypothetical protein
MQSKNQTVDREYLASLELVPQHDIAAVDAIYPGFIDEAIERIGGRFAGKQADGSDLGHYAALVLAEVWEKRGGAQVSETVSARLQQATSDAAAWLDSAPAVAAVRVSQRPPAFSPPAPVKPQGSGTL